MRSRSIAVGFVSALAISLVLGRSGAAQDQPPDGTGIPSWQVQFGGFEQLVDAVALTEDRIIGIDPVRIGGGGAEAEDQTAIVVREAGVWRVEQVLQGPLLGAMDLAGPRAGLAVGENGSAARFDGLRWHVLDTGLSIRLTDVSLVSAEEGWVSGGRETMLRWDGATLEPVETPEEIFNSTIVGVSAPAEDAAWAVTNRGRMIRYDGDAWRMEEDVPELAAYHGIDFFDAESGLAAGGSALCIR